MNKLSHQRWIFKTCLFLSCFFVSSNLFSKECDCENKPTVYAQLSSSTTQVPGMNQENVILENVDAIYGLKVKSNTNIIIQEPGIYFIMANGQVGANNIPVFGHVSLCLIQNGNVLPNTIISQVVNSIGVYDITSQATLNLKKHDFINVGVSATTPSLGLISPKNSASPTITVTIFKIGN